MNRPVVFRLTNNLDIGGVQKRIATVLPLLSENFEPHVAVYRHKGTLYDLLPQKNVPTHFCPIHGKLHIPSILRFKRLLQRNKATILHTHSLGANIPGILAAALAGVPVRIAQVHRKNYHWYAKSAMQRRKQIAIESIVHKLFTDIILFVSQESCDYFQKTTHISPQKLKILHNGIPIPQNRPPKLEAKIQNDLPLDKIVVGFVGRFSEGKGVQYFLNYAQQILTENDGFYFVLVGDGPQRAMLEQTIQKKGLTNAIHFVGQTKKVDQWYASFDLLFFTSDPDAEGMPGVALEASSYGLPILARESAPLQEIQKYYSKIAFLNENESPHKQALDALNLEEKVNLIAQEFSIENMSIKTSTLYKKLLQKKIHDKA